MRQQENKDRDSIDNPFDVRCIFMVSDYRED